MATVAEAVEVSIERARERAERAIQKILLDLEHDTNRRVRHVEADTRNFANYKVELFFEDQ
jgi:hypothetical protein